MHHQKKVPFQKSKIWSSNHEFFRGHVFFAGEVVVFLMGEFPFVEIWWTTRNHFLSAKALLDQQRSQSTEVSLVMSLVIFLGFLKAGLPSYPEV